MSLLQATQKRPAGRGLAVMWALIAALGHLERFYWIQLRASVTLGTLRLERGRTDKSHSGISSLLPPLDSQNPRVCASASAHSKARAVYVGWACLCTHPEGGTLAGLCQRPSNLARPLAPSTCPSRPGLSLDLSPLLKC